VTTVAVHREVVYATPLGFRPLVLDLHVPRQPAAVCLYLHGGGWRAGSRREGPGAAATWFFDRVARHGLAVASVDYRLSGEARFPAQCEDVAAAARFLAEHADRYGLPDAQVVWGVSAGGHLAALHALRDATTRAAVCWYAPTDLATLADDVADASGRPDRGAASREGMLVGGPLNERRAQVAEASPVTWAARATSPPPFLLVHGDADSSVPPRQSRRLADALGAAGGRVRMELAPGGTHMLPELDDAATGGLVDRCARFLLDAARG
jgi:acetyl esterase/lipase